jgi:hypothetical protein
MSSEDLEKINEHAWNIVARSKYAHDVEEDVAFLSAGGISLISHERRSSLGVEPFPHMLRWIR